MNTLSKLLLLYKKTQNLTLPLDIYLGVGCSHSQVMEILPFEVLAMQELPQMLLSMSDNQVYRQQANFQPRTGQLKLSYDNFTFTQ